MRSDMLARRFWSQAGRSGRLLRLALVVTLGPSIVRADPAATGSLNFAVEPDVRRDRRWPDSKVWGCATTVVMLLLRPALPATAASILTFVGVQQDGVGGVTNLGGPNVPAVSPDGAHVYVTASGSAGVTVFARNASTGALTFVESDVDVADLADAYGVAVSPDGRHVYAVGSQSAAIVSFSRSSTTGALTFIEAHKNGVDGVSGLYGANYVVVSPEGTSVYV